MKNKLPLLGFLLLQGCSVAALMESNVAVQPVFKSVPASVDENVTEAVNATSSQVQTSIQKTSDYLEVNKSNVLNDMNVGAPEEIFETRDEVVEKIKQQVRTPVVSGANIFLQVGMFKSLEGAQQVKANAQAATDVAVRIQENANKEYRVLVGPITASQLYPVEQQLAAAGFSYFRYSPVQK